MPRGKPRTVRFCVLLSEAERETLDRLAKSDRRTDGDWLRDRIAREAAKRGKRP